MLLVFLAEKRFILDIHDLYDTSKESSNSCKRLVVKRVQRFKKVIIHSDKVQNNLTHLVI